MLTRVLRAPTTERLLVDVGRAHLRIDVYADRKDVTTAITYTSLRGKKAAAEATLEDGKLIVPGHVVSEDDADPGTLGIVLRIPQGVAVDATVHHGSISSQTLLTDAVLCTGRGDVDVLVVEGRTTLYATQGDVHVGKARGVLNATALDGGIHLREAEADIVILHAPGGRLSACVGGSTRLKATAACDVTVEGDYDRTRVTAISYLGTVDYR